MVCRPNLVSDLIWFGLLCRIGLHEDFKTGPISHFLCVPICCCGLVAAVHGTKPTSPNFVS